MQLKEYKPIKKPSDELVNLLRQKYGEMKNFDLLLSDFVKAFDFCVDNENVYFYPFVGHEGELNAHIALIIDKRLPKGEAFFGFLEIPKDVSSFQMVWEALIDKARSLGISTLKGPVNGSIWHQYRCIKETDGSDFFKSELSALTYYYDFLKLVKPNLEIQYYSAYREKFDLVLQKIQEGNEKLKAFGFEIKEAKNIEAGDLKIIADLSKTVFQNNWGYTELTDREFLKLYTTEKLDAHLNKLYLLYRDKDIVGYCSTVSEDKTTIICKTIALLPEYQGKGLGNALAFKVHMDAKDVGITKVIYALIREGNQVSNFPKDDAVIFRRYAAFEYKI
ncbi:MAG: GNAT family N-acetyltransferase [bacterium]|nr:GNAT family N-acetyltransferase [bacterium]